VSPETRASVLRIAEYWRGRTLTDLFQTMRTPDLRSALRGALLSNGHEWSGLGHVAMDYRLLLDLGVSGLKAQISRERAKMAVTDPSFFVKNAFYDACAETLDAMLEFAARYRDLARRMADAERDPVQRQDLADIAGVLERVPEHPAATFHEAMQSLWFLQLIPQIESNGYSVTPGRFDQYMYKYYQADIASGALSAERAQDLIDDLFLKMSMVMRVDSTQAAEINAGYAVGENLTLGGLARDGRDATNELSYHCLAANTHINLNQPNLTVRLHKGSSDHFLRAAISSISFGNGMPQLVNDEVIIPALQAKGITLEEARDYIPIGCDEIVVAGMWGRCNGGYVNFAKLVELTVNRGRDILFGEPCGVDQSSRSLETFAEFLAAFREQLDHAVALQAAEANLTDRVHQMLQPLPFVSTFLGGCLEKGCDCSDGGAWINTTGLVGVGTASCADSLAAVRELVYERRLLTLEQLAALLKSNFADAELLRQTALNRLPKFGNDDDTVDQLAVMLTDAYFDEIEKYTNERGGPFWASLYSVTAQIGLGNRTAALPDGRLAGQPLSDGLSPMYGMDRKGPTAALRSVAKIDLKRSPNGVIVNQRLAPNLLKTEAGIAKMILLLRSFVEIGGFHWQFNVISNETLLDAQAHPENYKNLTVRVAGYSALFAELSTKAQLSIIERYAANL
jgi:formate C-acetyltransferase